MIPTESPIAAGLMLAPLFAPVIVDGLRSRLHRLKTKRTAGAATPTAQRIPQPLAMSRKELHS